MRKESWGQFVEFPDSYFACSGRSHRRAWEKNLRRKKNKGRLEASPPSRFPGVQFNSLPYYLNTWNRLIVTGPGKLLPFTLKIEVSFSSFADHMIKLYRSTKQNGLVCRQGPMPSYIWFRARKVTRTFEKRAHAPTGLSGAYMATVSWFWNSNIAAVK